MPITLCPDSTVTFVLYAESREQLPLEAMLMLDDFEARESIILMGTLYRPHERLIEDSQVPGILKFTITWIEL